MKHFTLALMPILLTAGISFAATGMKARPYQLSDNQVSEVMETVNDGEIAIANYVLSATKNEEVKKFAQHMVNDHQLNNSAIKDIVAKKKITPVQSEKSAEIKMKGDTSRETLMKLTGKELDKAYIEDQVNAHQMVLDNLNNKLIPATTDSMLKAHLEKTSRKVKEHLTHAREIQSHMM